jgi:hypothetical protein
VWGLELATKVAPRGDSVEIALRLNVKFCDLTDYVTGGGAALPSGTPEPN